MGTLKKIIDQEKYTIDQASKKSGMSKSWWRQMCYQNKINYLKIGRKVLIPESTLEQVLADALIKSNFDTQKL